MIADVIDFLPVLLSGLATTVLLTMCALLISMVVGLFWALMGRSRLAPLRWISHTVVAVVRGIPIIVQLFYIYFVLPDLGVSLNAFLAGSVGLGLAYSVYQAENFRAGFDAVDPNLIEAAQSLGMSEALIMRRIMLPLAVRIALPPFGNTAVMLLKDSSIASTITVAELTRAGQLLAISTFKNMSVYTIVAILYLLLSLPLTLGIRLLERRRTRHD
jgi:polar amino acid transport system permease protein